MLFASEKNLYFIRYVNRSTSNRQEAKTVFLNTKYSPTFQGLGIYFVFSTLVAVAMASLLREVARRKA